MCFYYFIIYSFHIIYYDIIINEEDDLLRVFKNVFKLNESIFYDTHHRDCLPFFLFFYLIFILPVLTALELSFVGSFMGHRYYNLKHAVIFNVTIEAEDCIEHCYRNKYRYASIQVSVQIF